MTQLLFTLAAIAMTAPPILIAMVRTQRRYQRTLMRYIDMRVEQAAEQRLVQVFERLNDEDDAAGVDSAERAEESPR